MFRSCSGISSATIAQRRSTSRWASSSTAPTGGASSEWTRSAVVDLRRSPHDVAPELIGAELYVDGGGGVIVEVEAYDHEDPAAHGFGNRRTARNASMFLSG